jgi:16S rRNA (guanine527-N7)-methyltransferase
MPLTDLVKLVRKNVAKEQHNGLPNGLICLKGGELQQEIQPHKQSTLLYPLSDYFSEEFFDTKQAVYVQING